MKSQQKEDLQADPWENSLQNGNMGKSTPDEFFSLDLNSSYNSCSYGEISQHGRFFGLYCRQVWGR